MRFPVWKRMRMFSLRARCCLNRQTGCRIPPRQTSRPPQARIGLDRTLDLRGERAPHRHAPLATPDPREIADELGCLPYCCRAPCTTFRAKLDRNRPSAIPYVGSRAPVRPDRPRNRGVRRIILAVPTRRISPIYISEPRRSKRTTTDMKKTVVTSSAELIAVAAGSGSQSSRR